ncbi:hypothetical protein BV911_12805 [Pseudoruegeria sp. SK021]|nr:hypothetical protein BV911_12805 [Pseudoruegeria sp. SK021]
MHVAFSHQNFPAQFGAFGAYLASIGWRVTFFTGAVGATPPPGCQMVHMTPHRDPSQTTHRFAASMEKAMINAQAFANAAIAVRRQGATPDVVVGHSGWGSGTFAKSVWPESKFVAYAEWFYRFPPVDDTGESAAASPEDGRAHALTRNTPTLLDLAQADLAFCPTRFQADQFPVQLRDRLHILHDGVNAARIVPDRGSRRGVAGLPLPDDAEIVTYATRGMEPHRGFPEFLRAVAQLQTTRPRLHVVIGGEDRVAYGRRLPAGDSWKRRMLAELDLDLSRVHFTGLMPWSQYLAVLQSSHVHVYLTVPFVLSWSLIEAMSTGCSLVVSDTAPVREALDDGVSADMVDHTNIPELVAAIARQLDDRARALALGDAARQAVLRRYDQRWIWPARADLLERLVHG